MCAATEVESTKRKVTFSTYQKWRRDFDIEVKTVTWMDCATETSAGKTYVKCAKYKSRIIGRRNYSDRWINGAHSLRTSTIRDHAKSEQHQHAMSILCLEKGSATRVVGRSPTFAYWRYANTRRSGYAQLPLEVNQVPLPRQ